jgi:phosphatidylglycerophosphate synthase
MIVPMRRKPAASSASDPMARPSMLDRYALRLLKPAAEAAARALLARGLTADQLTLAGFVIGMASAVLIAFGHTSIAILPMLLSRAADGLDGAIARQSQTSDRGAFLDIGLDFIFYAAVPLAFAIADPNANALAAALLLASFLGTGTSFLAYAILAEKRGLRSTDYPSKSFYYLGGLTEGTETILCFVLMCLWPQHFALFATIYASMCAVTTVARLAAGWQAFRD